VGLTKKNIYVKGFDKFQIEAAKWDYLPVPQTPEPVTVLKHKMQRKQEPTKAELQGAHTKIKILNQNKWLLPDTICLKIKEVVASLTIIPAMQTHVS
jgi:hypothetical protein